ncbi:DUF2806 domain-containing protein [Pantoea sp. Z09]|uniref:DUF2806 domain-containing protein n=1 Tax=Pantoea sp. Z09 TaxID=2886821 RepID=UPI001EFEDFA0|nr:DUF2806 domain-containing protein [Pantoea sp. Z09]
MADGPYEKLILKLWDTVVDKGICGVLRPAQMRREGLAKSVVARNQILMLAQAEKDAEDVRNGMLISKIEGSNVVLKPNIEKYEPVVDLPSMYAVIREDIIIERVQNEINIAKTLLKAEKELEGQEVEVSEADIESDWINRWRDYACKVSTDEMQSIWARLLAGEVKSPGKFSFRTMEFIKNITKKEAQEIESVLPFIFKEGFIFRGYLQSNRTRYIHKWLSLDILLKMQELGIVQEIHQGNVTINLNGNKGETAFIRCNEKALTFLREGDSDINMPYIAVTQLGIQLAEIAGCNANEEYLLAVGEHLKTQGSQVFLVDYVDMQAGAIRVYNAKAL